MNLIILSDLNTIDLVEVKKLGDVYIKEFNYDGVKQALSEISVNLMFLLKNSN